jgi:hypothetical protein
MNAIFALAGVLLGAAISGVVQATLERRVERRQRLVALRLVHNELRVAESMVRGLLHVGQGDIRIYFERSDLDEVWRSYREVLAAELDEDAWDTVRQGATEFWWAAKAPMPAPPDMLKETAEALRAAQQAVLPHAQQIPRMLRHHRELSPDHN